MRVPGSARQWNSWMLSLGVIKADAGACDPRGPHFLKIGDVCFIFYANTFAYFPVIFKS